MLNHLSCRLVLLVVVFWLKEIRARVKSERASRFRLKQGCGGDEMVREEDVELTCLGSG